MKNYFFENKSQISIHIIENTQFGVISMEKSKSKVRDCILLVKREKMMKLTKINYLILKLKSNAK